MPLLSVLLKELKPAFSTCFAILAFQRKIIVRQILSRFLRTSDSPYNL